MQTIALLVQYYLVQCVTSLPYMSSDIMKHYCRGNTLGLKLELVEWDIALAVVTHIVLALLSSCQNNYIRTHSMVQHELYWSQPTPKLVLRSLSVSYHQLSQAFFDIDYET